MRLKEQQQASYISAVAGHLYLGIVGLELKLLS
jgi:hypothetical protein